MLAVIDSPRDKCLRPRRSAGIYDRALVLFTNMLFGRSWGLLQLDRVGTGFLTQTKTSMAADWVVGCFVVGRRHCPEPCKVD